jgi:hypothetical protein
MLTAPYPTPCAPAACAASSPAMLPTTAAGSPRSLLRAGPSRSLLPPTAFPSYAAMLDSTVVLHVPPSVAPPQIRVMSLHRWWWGASDRTRAVEEETEGASRPRGWPGREQGSSASSPWVAPGSHAASCGEEEEGPIVPDVSGWSKEPRSRTPAASTPGITSSLKESTLIKNQN